VSRASTTMRVMNSLPSRDPVPITAESSSGDRHPAVPLRAGAGGRGRSAALPPVKAQSQDGHATIALG